MKDLKFPKEIKEVYEALNYYNQKMYSKCVSVLKEIDIVDKYKENEVIRYTNIFDTNILDAYIESLYRTNNFEKLVIISEELLKNEYESYLVNYYTILAYLGLFDLFSINSYLKRSANIKQYIGQIQNLESSYSSYLNLSGYEQKVFILLNFVSELSREIYTPTSSVSLNNEYLLTRFYDLINLLNDYGFDSNIIINFTDDISNLFVYSN